MFSKLKLFFYRWLLRRQVDHWPSRFPSGWRFHRASRFSVFHPEKKKKKSKQQKKKKLIILIKTKTKTKQNLIILIETEDFRPNFLMIICFFKIRASCKPFDRLSLRGNKTFCSYKMINWLISKTCYDKTILTFIV